MRDQRYLYALASETELNELVSGRGTALGRPWPFKGSGLRQSSGQVGVLWAEPMASDAPVRPLALVVDGTEQRRLFARFAQLRSDLSPLSAWCHILTPALFATLDEPAREADLGGLEASWAGLVIAEAAVLSDRPVSQLKLAACLATQTFAVARSLAIWPGVSTADTVANYDLLQRDIRSGGGQDLSRANFAPLWSTLASASLGYGSPSGPHEQISNAVAALRRARESGMDELLVLQSAFDHQPEASFLSALSSASPEDRLRDFDRLVAKIADERPSSSSTYRAELCFLAGYLATVAAGGAASLGLAANVAKSIPEISGWAYLIGGLGERVTWSGGFSGLGRLVARELLRPFRIDEAPTADFAAEEARVLVDKQLSDPLVHLQLKQARIATAALYPGVNLQVPFAEQVPEQRRQVERRPSSAPVSSRQSSAEEALGVIADLLAPILLDKLRGELSVNTKEKAAKPKWQKGPQRKLPLADD